MECERKIKQKQGKDWRPKDVRPGVGLNIDFLLECYLYKPRTDVKTLRDATKREINTDAAR